MQDKPKVALVCDWLTIFAGAERVILELHELYPDAPIYTTLYNPKKCPQFKNAVVHESRLGWIPGARYAHRLLFPFMPRAFERMDLDEFDIVISSCHSASKGIITKPDTLHISYCHSPMRYVWDQSHQYQNQFDGFSRFKWLFKPILHKVRIWDRIASERVDRFIANSDYVAKRILKYYGKPSTVIFPPVNLHKFTPGNEVKEEYYLAVGRFINYKRFDLIVRACTQMERKLKLVGGGPEFKNLKRLGKDKVEFLGKLTDEELRSTYRKAKALIFPQAEDFGIVPLEAMACGTPVIAYAKGGALETVKKDVSGLFFHDQEVDSLIEAIERFESKKWDPKIVSESVEHFSSARFKSEIRGFVEEAWKLHQKSLE